MVSLYLLSAFAAVASIVSAQSPTTSGLPSHPTDIEQPSGTVNPPTSQEQGCFNSSTPLELYGTYNSQSSGNCQRICFQQKRSIWAVSDGTKCWCGELLPTKQSRQKDNAECNTPCGGTGAENCGGDGHWRVATTGLSLNAPKNYEPAPEPSSSSSSAPHSTQSTQNSAQTSTTAPAPGNNSGGGSNKTAIAVGVVVGVVVLLAIIGGVFFYLRQQRRRQVEAEFRRQAEINSFTAGGKLHTSNSSITDSRLDPEFMNRRQSNGSIADNEDYSRRILKVTNA